MRIDKNVSDTVTCSLMRMTNTHVDLSHACSSLLLALAAGCTSTAAHQESNPPVGLEGPALSSQDGGAIKEFESAHDGFVKRAVFVPPIVLRGAWMPDAQLGSEPGHFDMWEFEFDATVPLPIDRDSFLIFGLETGKRDIKFTNVQTVADDTLYRVGPKLGYGTFLSDDFVVQAFWQPSIYSDFGGRLQSRDYRPEYGTALAVYRKSDDLFWKFGFKITDAIDTGVIPIAGVMWHFKERWMLDVLAPRHAQVRYRADEKWTLSGGFLIRSDEYRIRGPISIGKPEHDVQVQEVLLQVSSEFNVTDNLSSEFTIGTTIAGEWDWGYGNGQPKYDGTLEAGLFLEWGLGWRF